MTTRNLTERAGEVLEQAQVQGNVIQGVSVLTSQSRNGRRYTSQALADVAELAEGVRVHLDHSNRTPRSVTTLVGFLTSPRVVEDRVRANLHVLAGDRRDFVLSLAEEEAQDVGLSISAKGDIRREDGIDVVERVAMLRTVDLVCSPATTKSLHESEGFDSGRVRVRREPRPITDEIVEEAATELFT